jgi:hypothetical protein
MDKLQSCRTGPCIRKVAGYLILALIAITVGMLIFGNVVPGANLHCSLLFFPFWLPTVILGWLGRKAARRFTASADEATVGANNHGATGN